MNSFINSLLAANPSRNVSLPNPNQAMALGMRGVGDGMDALQAVGNKIKQNRINSDVATALTTVDGNLDPRAYQDSLFKSIGAIDGVDPLTAIGLATTLSKPRFDAREYTDSRIDAESLNNYRSISGGNAQRPNMDVFTNEDGKVFMYNKKDGSMNLVEIQGAGADDTPMPVMGGGLSSNDGYETVDVPETHVSPWVAPTSEAVQYDPNAQATFEPIPYDGGIQTKIDTGREYDQNTTRELAEYGQQLFKWAGNNKKKQAQAKLAYKQAEEARKGSRGQYDLTPQEDASMKRIDAQNKTSYDQGFAVNQPKLSEKDKTFVDSYGSDIEAIGRINNSFGDTGIWGGADAITGTVGAFFGTGEGSRQSLVSSDLANMKIAAQEAIKGVPSDKDTATLELSIPSISDQPGVAKAKLAQFRQKLGRIDAGKLNRLYRSNPAIANGMFEKIYNGDLPEPYGYDVMYNTSTGEYKIQKEE